MGNVAVLLLACSLICRAADPAGRWEGSAEIPGSELRLIVDLAQTSDGHWTGSAILPGSGVKGASLADLTVTGSAVAFVIHGVLGDPRLSGHLTAEGHLAGDFTQAGNTAPFVLRRTGAPQVEPPRPRVAVRKELEGEWRGEFDLLGNKLHARLTLTNSSAGTTAKFVVGGQKDTDLPVDFVSQDGDWLMLNASYGISYEGRFHAGRGEITGTFAQGGFESPLVFRRVPNP